MNVPARLHTALHELLGDAQLTAATLPGTALKLWLIDASNMDRAFNPEETRRFLAKELNTSEYWVTAAYGEDAHRRLRTTLDSRSIDALQDFTEFLFRWGFIPRRFDVREWIDFSVLERVIGSTSRLAV